LVSLAVFPSTEKQHSHRWASERIRAGEKLFESVNNGVNSNLSIGKGDFYITVYNIYILYGTGCLTTGEQWKQCFQFSVIRFPINPIIHAVRGGLRIFDII